MSTEKIDEQTSAPNYMKFGFSNAEELAAFLRTDIGKMIQSETVNHYLEQKENERITFEYFQAAEEKRRAFVAYAIMYQESKDEETKQKNAEASAKSPVAPPPQAPKAEQFDKPSVDNSNPYLKKLDKVNKDIIATSAKYEEYADKEKVANNVACSIDEDKGLSKEQAVDKLDKMIAELEAEQERLQQKFDPEAGLSDEELTEVVRQNNKNEVTLGVYRTLRDVKAGKTEMYDEKGDKTDKFAKAKYTVSSDKEIVKDPKSNTFYLIDKKEENKGLTAEQKLQNMTSTEKNQAAAAFKKEEPSMLNVKDFLQNNKSAELKALFDQKNELQSELDKSLTNSVTPSQQVTPDNNSPQSTEHSEPGNTFLSPFTPGSVAHNLGSMVTPDTTSSPLAGPVATGPDGGSAKNETDEPAMKSPG